MIGELTDEQAYRAEEAAQVYHDAKKTKPSAAVLGFIKKNAIIGRTIKEIDTLVSRAKKLSGGVLLGEGDKFKEWCESLGREVPSDELIRLMNRDPYDARGEVRRMIPTNLKLWRAYCSYLAGRGGDRV